MKSTAVSKMYPLDTFQVEDTNKRVDLIFTFAEGTKTIRIVDWLQEMTICGRTW